MQKSTHQ